MYHPRNQLTGPPRLPFPKQPLKWYWCRAGVGTAHGLPTEAARALNSNRGQEGTYCSNQVCQSFMACWSKITGQQGRCAFLDGIWLIFHAQETCKSTTHNPGLYPMSLTMIYPYPPLTARFSLQRRFFNRQK